MIAMVTPRVPDFNTVPVFLPASSIAPTGTPCEHYGM